MMVLSPDGNVLNVNQAHINLWGVSRELTKTFNILADPQLERLGLMPTIRRAMAGEQVSIPAVAYDLSATLGEGASKVVQGDFYPIRDANGAVRHIILIHQDITERKRMEEELRRHHENLEGLVRERTASRARQPGQEHVPGQHVARDPHAHERDPRLLADPAQDPGLARRTSASTWTSSPAAASTCCP